MKPNRIIMVVDDNDNDRFFFRNAIKQINEQYELREAVNGLDAVDQLKAQSLLPDFIFLDLNMPLMNGWECLQEIKKDESLKDIPVIIHSTAFYEDNKNLIQMGAAYYLTKPTDVTSLAARISYVIKKVEQRMAQLAAFSKNGKVTSDKLADRL